MITAISLALNHKNIVHARSTLDSVKVNAPPAQETMLPTGESDASCSLLLALEPGLEVLERSVLGEGLDSDSISLDLSFLPQLIES